MAKQRITLVEGPAYAPEWFNYQICAQSASGTMDIAWLSTWGTTLGGTVASPIASGSAVTSYSLAPTGIISKIGGFILTSTAALYLNTAVSLTGTGTGLVETNFTIAQARWPIAASTAKKFGKVYSEIL
jgi:hypothetical protein